MFARKTCIAHARQSRHTAHREPTHSRLDDLADLATARSDSAPSLAFPVRIRDGPHGARRPHPRERERTRVGPAHAGRRAAACVADGVVGISLSLLFVAVCVVDGLFLAAVSSQSMRNGQTVRLLPPPTRLPCQATQLNAPNHVIALLK